MPLIGSFRVFIAGNPKLDPWLEVWVVHRFVNLWDKRKKREGACCNETYFDGWFDVLSAEKVIRPLFMVIMIDFYIIFWCLWVFWFKPHRSDFFNGLD